MEPNEKPKTRNERYLLAEEHLRHNRIEASLAELRIVDALDKIEQHNTWQRRSLAAVAIVFLTLVVISVGLTWRLNSTEVDLTVKTTFVEFVSSSQKTPVLVTPRIVSAGIRIDDLGYFDTLPPIAPKAIRGSEPQSVPTSISVEAKSVTLEELSLEPLERHPTVSIDLRQGNADLYVRDSVFGGQLTITEPTRLTVSRNDRDVSLSERDFSRTRYFTRYFKSRHPGDTAIPNKLSILGLRQLEVAVKDLRSVRFSREHPPGSGSVQSAIVSGSLRLLELGRTLDIASGEYLSLDCKDCTRNFIRFENGYVVFSLRGTLQRLTGGHEEDLENFAPTLLMYFYHNEKLAMLWAATLFVFGLFWNLRKL